MNSCNNKRRWSQIWVIWDIRHVQHAMQNVMLIQRNGEGRGGEIPQTCLEGKLLIESGKITLLYTSYSRNCTTVHNTLRYQHSQMQSGKSWPWRPCMHTLGSNRDRQWTGAATPSPATSRLLKNSSANSLMSLQPITTLSPLLSSVTPGPKKRCSPTCCRA